jgi:hypothetical protein
MRSLVLGAFLLSSAAGWAAEMHWVRLDVPAARDIALWGERLVVRGRDGELWVDGATMPSHPAVGSADRMASAPDGVWLYKAQPAWAVRLRDGRWGEREPLPVGDASSLVVDSEDRAWTAGLFGEAAVREADGWRVLELGRGHLDVRPDPTGGVWFWSSEGDGSVVHRGGGHDEERAGITPWSSVVETLTVAEDGEPLWSDWRLPDPGPVRRWGEDARPMRLTVAGGAAWGWQDGGAVELVSGQAMVLPTRSIDQLLATHSGGAVARSGSRVYRAVVGPSVAFRPAEAPWTVQHLGSFDVAVAVDVDRDGRPDLVALEAGRLRLLRQEARGFLDRTEDVGMPEQRVLGVAKLGSDVDGDGHEDLAVRIEEGWALLRILDGWVQLVEVDSIAAQGSLAGGHGRPTAADLDGDGDPDLVLTTSGFPDLDERVGVFLNDGLGRLGRLPMAQLSLDRNAFVAQVHPGDLNGDGHLDFVLATFWGHGHDVLLGGPDRLRDVSVGSGLNGVYAEPRFSWLVDVDGDGCLDFATDGAEHRSWRGGCDGSFVDQTDKLGLTHAEGVAGTAALRDLNGDGRLDLLRIGEERAQLFVGCEAGLCDRSAGLPPLPEEAGKAVVMDLGGDGDLDVLFLGAGAWENAGVAPPAKEPVRWSSAPVQRRLAWAGVWDLGLAGVLLLGLVGVQWRVRRSGSRLALGRPPVGLLLTSVALGALVWSLEARWGVRVAVTAILLVAAVVGGGVEAVHHSRRSARRIAGYRVRGVLGRGGMGTVYLADAPTSGERVALKVVDPGLMADEHDRVLYRREAELGASIDDPRVVRILGYGEWTMLGEAHPRPTAYLVMELVRGSSLRQVMHEHGRFSPGQAAHIAREIALGLEAVHQAGVVHRDIKPENVALGHDGSVKLMDFGAARRVGHQTATAHDVLGTIGYLAIEQARGDPPTPRSDVYAVGVVLYELLAGTRPFQGADLVSVLSAMVEGEAAPIPGIDPRLAGVVDAAMATEPAHRFPSALTLAEALEPFAEKGVLAVSEAPLGVSAEVSLEPSTSLGAHLGNVLYLMRAYFSHFRRGGRPDLDQFALELLKSDAQESGPAEATMPRRTLPPQTER